MDQTWNWLVWLVAILVTIVVVRATVRFDVNEWLRDRRKQREEHLRLLCPHVRLVNSDGEPAICSTYISPVGTTAWQCQLCGNVTYDRSEGDEVARYWATNTNELIKRHKDMARLAKKLGRC